MSLQLLFLGTGTSAGVPMIGCDCAVCRSSDPRDTRTRSSVLIRYPHQPPPAAAAMADHHQPPTGSKTTAGDRPHQFLIDTTPEMRIQMIAHDIFEIDGVFYTHAHADHIFGIDDLRRFNAVMEAPVQIMAEPGVFNLFDEMFPYIFKPHRNINRSFIPMLIKRPIAAGRAFELHGAKWTPLRLNHGRLPILGFRIDWHSQSIAYCTDMSSFPPETYDLLRDLDILVIDGLRYRHHPTHLTIDQALQEIAQIQPRTAYLTHLAHDVSHAQLQSELPRNVFVAHDGLLVEA